MKLLSNDERIEIVLRYECGEPSPSIAVAMSRSLSAIFTALRKAGISSRKSGRRTVTKETDLIIRELYIQGKSNADIAHAVRCGTSSVERALHRLTLTEREEPQRIVRRPRYVKLNLAERFWSKVARDDSRAGCWDWMRSVRKDGYGRFGIDGRVEAAHRVAFYLAYGRWPNIGRHTCDRAICCRPDHILDGTNADNSRDMVDRDRSTRGERSGNAKLTEALVREIRARVGTTKQKQLAKEYGVSEITISRIVRGQRWGHVV